MAQAWAWLQFNGRPACSRGVDALSSRDSVPGRHEDRCPCRSRICLGGEVLGLPVLRRVCLFGGLASASGFPGAKRVATMPSKRRLSASDGGFAKRMCNAARFQARAERPCCWVRAANPALEKENARDVRTSRAFVSERREISGGCRPPGARCARRGKPSLQGQGAPGASRSGSRFPSRSGCGLPDCRE